MIIRFDTIGRKPDIIAELDEYIKGYYEIGGRGPYRVLVSSKYKETIKKFAEQKAPNRFGVHKYRGIHIVYYNESSLLHREQ